MEQNNGGKRAMPQGGIPLGGKIAIIAVAALAALLIGGYFGLCAYVNNSDRALPHTFIEGGDLSGLSRAEAESAVRTIAEQSFGNRTVRLTYPGGTTDVTGALLEVDAAAVADAAIARGRSGSFVGMGMAWLKAQFSNETLTMEAQLSEEGARLVDEAAREITSKLDSTLTDTTYELTDDALVLHKGTSGVSADPEAIHQSVVDALMNGKDTVEVIPVVTAPTEPDFESIYRDTLVEAADAYLDKTTKEIVPSVTGISFDIAAARSTLEQTAEGATGSVPLDKVAPKMTTDDLTANLFKDVLGATKTVASGPSGRWTNIKLASSFINDYILLPGEVFSYNAMCEPYTLDHGYVNAGTYQNGKSVDAAAGGICQLSSTLYWATLEANLETVERTKHIYNTGYLPIVGTDATVFSGSPDFKFKNSTDYPVKIQASIDSSHVVRVTILGTNATGIYGDPYSITLSTTPGGTLYVPKAEIPVGTTQRDPEMYRYDGIKVEVHQRLRDKDGNVISDVVIHTDTYKPRDTVYWYNPADKAALGIDDAGRKTLPPVTPTPAPSVEPSPSTDPAVSPSPSQDPSVPTPSPTPSTEQPTPPPAEPTPTPTEPTPPPAVPTETPPPGIVVTPSAPPATEAPAEETPAA